MTATAAPVSIPVGAHPAALLRLAHRHSLCEDDAQDACQRAIEIYLERAHRIAPETAAAWLRTVCKHEAMRIRAARQRMLPAEPLEFDKRPSDGSEVHERAVSLERVDRVREALTACSGDELRALLLQADGATYAEIAERCGFSLAKVNRVLSDGRGRFQRRFNAIEAGRACARHRVTLEAIVAGRASVDDFVALRPHLRHCGGCRAELRALYAPTMSGR